MKILITGGAGFIGSNLAEALFNNQQVEKVRVLDNFATGFKDNIAHLLSHSKFEFIEGDICDLDVCKKACEGMDRISHQAALGSVPRSIQNPIKTNEVNIGGTLNIFVAAKEHGVDRIVYAASSSTYGDSEALPKVEDKIGKPLSPYAVTKLVNEIYADVFHKLYGTDFIGLRYFNIFGPKQSSTGAYAAVIPLFFKYALTGEAPTINGDGTYSRDFTFVANAVQANELALFTDNSAALNQVYNIAVGERTSLNELWRTIKDITQTEVKVRYGDFRKGDVPHSLASIEKAVQLLGYQPNIKIEEGLRLAYEWYKTSV